MSPEHNSLEAYSIIHSLRLSINCLCLISTINAYCKLCADLFKVRDFLLSEIIMYGHFHVNFSFGIVGTRR